MKNGDSILILISGFKRSGKDFSAEYLSQRIKDSVVCSFAEPMKDILATSFAMDLQTLDNLKNESSHFRAILQRFGSEAMKKWFGDTVWSDVFIKNAPDSPVVILADWRFPTEVEVLSKVYSRIITIRVHDYNNTNTDMHVSETALLDFNFDYEVDNTLKDSTLFEKLESILINENLTKDIAMACKSKSKSKSPKPKEGK